MKWGDSGVEKGEPRLFNVLGWGGCAGRWGVHVAKVGGHGVLGSTGKWCVRVA